jgi:hypothetical protein
VIDPEPGTEGGIRIYKVRRRATTEPPQGSDPSPAREPERHTLTENDERLRAEKPPHY